MVTRLSAILLLDGLHCRVYSTDCENGPPKILQKARFQCVRAYFEKHCAQHTHTHTGNGCNNNRDEKIDRFSAYVFLLRARVVRGCTEFTVVLLNRSGLGRNNRHWDVKVSICARDKSFLGGIIPSGMKIEINRLFILFSFGWIFLTILLFDLL